MRIDKMNFMNRLVLIVSMLFPALVATRMLTTLAIAYTSAARYPENAAYILRNVPTARDGLTALARLDPATIQTAMEAL